MANLENINILQDNDNAYSQIVTEIVQKTNNNFNELGTQINSLDAEKANQTALETEKARISNLVANAGNTDGNAELLDIRVDSQGKVFATAGDAIRSVDSRFILGKNKFDGKYRNDIIASASNTVMAPTNQAITNISTAIVKIEPNKTYTVTKYLGGNRFTIMLIDQYPTVDVLPLNALYVYRGASSSSKQTHTFTNTYEAQFAIIQAAYDLSNPPNLQVEEAEIETEYERPGVKIKDLIPDIPLETSEKNIFDGTTYIQGYLGRSDGSLYFMAAPTSPSARVAVIPIVPEKTYTISFVDESEFDRFRIASHKDMPNFVASITNKANTVIYDNNDVPSTVTFTNNSEDNFLFIHVTNSEAEPRMQVEENLTATSYEPYKFINKKYLPTVKEKQTIKNYIHGNFNDYYNSPTMESAGEGDVFNLHTSTIEDIYSIYDNLMSQFPFMVEKSLLGYGGNSDNIADTNLPIYEYFIKTPTGATGLQTPSKNILITSGVHGDEKSSVWSLTQFIKLLMIEWTSHDNLESILSNINLKIIPIANPGGYNANTRYNLHGVDINRNSGYKWDEYNPSQYPQPKGDAPYSELEVQILRDWFINNKLALTYIDVHNAFNSGNAGYILTNDKSLQKIYSSLARRLTNKWRRKYGALIDVVDGKTQVQIRENDSEPMMFNEATIQGLKHTAILEIKKYHSVTSNTQNEYSNVVIERGIEMITNYILSILDGYSKNFMV